MRYTEAQLARIALGLPLDGASADASAGVIQNIPAPADADAGAAPATPVAPTTPAAPATPAAPVAPQSPAGAPATPAAAPVADASAQTVTAYLEAQLGSAREAVATARAEAADLKTQLATAQVHHEALIEIARNSFGNMSVALGGRADAAAGMDTATLLAETARLSAQFKDKFKVGQVSRPSTPSDDSTASAVVVDPVQAFLISRVKG